MPEPNSQVGSTLDQLETRAATAIGRILMVISRLEANIGFFAAHACYGGDHDKALARFACLHFADKLKALDKLVGPLLASDEKTATAYRKWRAAVDEYRDKRNGLVHGRWGFHNGTCINVVCDRSAVSTRDVRYSVDELENEVEAARQLSTAFSSWSQGISM